MILKFCLGILSTEKNPLKPIKIATSGSRIFAYFPKGLTKDLGQKDLFFSFFVEQKMALKFCLGIFSTDKIVLSPQK